MGILMQQMKDSKNFPNSFTGMSKLEREWAAKDNAEVVNALIN